MPQVRKVKVDGKDAGYAEAIPPGGSVVEDPLIGVVAALMDSVFRVPGTKIRFGLDPLMGLLPGVGDGAGALVSVFLIGLSARYGVPKIVMARMAANVVLNAIIGVVPLAGDLFSVYYKSNKLNYELLQKHAGARRASTTGDWLFVGGLIGTVLLIVGLAIFGAIMLLRAIFG